MLIGERLKAIRENLSMSGMKFAEELEIGYSAYMHYEKDRSDIPEKLIQQITSKYNINLQWLFTGNGEMFLSDGKTNGDGASVMVPLLDLKASAGFGVDGSDEYRILEYIPIAKSQLDDLPFALLRAIRVSGDSMEPKFWDGDVVFYVENRPKRIVDGVYVINRGGMLMIKKLQVISQSEVDIISANTSYSTIRIRFGEGDFFQVVGKVIGKLEWFSFSIEE